MVGSGAVADLLRGATVRKDRVEQTRAPPDLEERYGEHPGQVLEEQGCLVGHARTLVTRALAVTDRAGKGLAAALTWSDRLSDPGLDRPLPESGSPQDQPGRWLRLFDEPLHPNAATVKRAGWRLGQAVSSSQRLARIISASGTRL